MSLCDRGAGFLAFPFSDTENPALTIVMPRHSKHGVFAAAVLTLELSHSS